MTDYVNSPQSPRPQEYCEIFPSVETNTLNLEKRERHRESEVREVFIAVRKRTGRLVDVVVDGVCVCGEREFRVRNVRWPSRRSGYVIIKQSI